PSATAALSVVRTIVGVVVPALRAGLPGNGRWVGVRPPLLASGASTGLIGEARVPIWLPRLLIFVSDRSTAPMGEVITGRVNVVVEAPPTTSGVAVLMLPAMIVLMIAPLVVP